MKTFNVAVELTDRLSGLISITLETVQAYSREQAIARAECEVERCAILETLGEYRPHDYALHSRAWEA